jgi:uncharacterized membrane protein
MKAPISSEQPVVAMARKLPDLLRVVSQVGLGLFLTSAGYSHLTVNRLEFQAQVPTWLPLDPDFVVLASGVVEIALGLALLTLWRYRAHVGLAAALFFVAIFPGNINQFVNGIDAFGLNSDTPEGCAFSSSRFWCCGRSGQRGR